MNSLGNPFNLARKANNLVRKVKSFVGKPRNLARESNSLAHNAQSLVSGLRFAPLLAALVLSTLVCACNANPSAAQSVPTAVSTGTTVASASSTYARAAPSTLTTNPYATTPSHNVAVIGMAAPAASSASASLQNKSATQDKPDLTLGSHEKEMDYFAFRQYVKNKGWTPIANAKCMENVVGGDYKSQCASHANGMCGACRAIPELSSCGAGGVCLMRFHNAARHQDVDVGTTGDITDWKGEGKNSSLLVTGWAVSTAAQ